MSANAEEGTKRKAETEALEAAKKARAEAEKEKDDAVDKRPAIETDVCFHSVDTTLNVFSAVKNKVLMGLTEGGMQHLMAGARASVGVKTGRYFYEVKILESFTVNEAAQGKGAQGQGPQPRQVLRLGFSTSSAPLLLADSEESVYFEADGMFVSGKTRQKKSQPISRDNVTGILLNLDAGSPLANTISIFRDGIRVSEPQALPDCLKGKALFPHVTFRHVSVQVNMGATPMKALPFQCRMIQSAAKGDVEALPDPSLAGKFEVLIPVGIPGEGTAEWLDGFLQKHPKHVELSDRKIQDWAVRSGLPKPGRPNPGSDKAVYNVRSMDDGSIQRVVKAITPMVPRNYVVMDEKFTNLVKDERIETLRRFITPNFKKVALVVMGEPDKEFKQKSYMALLIEKQAKIDAEWKVKKAAAKRQKELQEMRRKADEQRKKKLEEAKKKEDGEAKDEEMKEEEEIKQEVIDEDDGLGDEPPKAELTEEDKKKVFRTKTVDFGSTTLSKHLHQFSLPEKAEGFDEVRFVWDAAAKCKEHLRKWILEAKSTTLIEHLQPSPEFTAKFMAWQKHQLEWQQKQNIWKVKPKKPEDEAKAAEVKGSLDIFSVEDVNDIHDGEPLYSLFEPADWALLQLRYEIYLLQEAFKKDVNDPDRSAIPEPHLSFYYNRYLKKQLNPGTFGLKNNTELLQMIKDVVTLSGDPAVLTSQLDGQLDSPEIFVKLTEEERRERKRRAEAGEETSALKYIPPTAAPPPPAARQAQQWQQAPRQPPRPQQWQGGGGGWNRW